MSDGRGDLARFERELRRAISDDRRSEKVLAARIAGSDRLTAALKRQVDALRKPVEHQVWTWIEKVHEEGTAARIADLYLAAGKAGWRAEKGVVRLLGPVAEDGTASKGGTGSIWIDLYLKQVAVQYSRRTGPSWGDEHDLKGEEGLRRLPPNVLIALDKALRGGGVWRHILRDLREHLIWRLEHERAVRSNKQWYSRTKLAELDRAVKALRKKGKERPRRPSERR